MLIQISWLDQYTVRITCCGHQSNNPVIINSGPTGKTCVRRTRLWECLGIWTRIYASRDAGFCVPEKPKFITGCSECLSFPHCQYTASLDLDTFQEIFLLGNYRKLWLWKGYIDHSTCKHWNAVLREAQQSWSECADIFHIQVCDSI